MKIKLISGIVFLSILLLSYKESDAQSWQWTKSIGSTANEWGISIAVDPISGSTYTTGGFYGTVDFDPGPDSFYLSGYLYSNEFISKLDSAGNFVWAVVIEGVECFSIARDPSGSGSIYTTGFFAGPVDFDPGPGVHYLQGSGIFISKLDSAGNFIWAKKMGSTYFDWAQAIAVDDSGYVYTTGSFDGTEDFDPGPDIFNLTSSDPSTGYVDIFVSKLDSLGNFVWAKSMGGTSYYNEGGWCITADTAGNVYTTGFFTGTSDFNPGAGIYNLTSVGNEDIFISKLNSSGNFMWAKAMGEQGQDQGYAIVVDPGNGDVYTTGLFQEYYGEGVDFDPGPGTYLLYGTGMFISKLDSIGNFVWAKGISTGGYGGLSVAIDYAGNGDVYTTGYFYGTTDFDPGAGMFNLSAGDYHDIFVSKLTSAGNFVWAVSVGEAGTNDFGYDLALNTSGKVHVTGAFTSPTISFDCTTLTNTESVCYDDYGNEYVCYHFEAFITQLDGIGPPFSTLVTNTNDTGIGSLRDVIGCSSNGATITFDNTLLDQTITLTSGEIVINKNLTLAGLGMWDFAISGNNSSRVFSLPYGKQLEIRNLSLENTNEVIDGGAILVQGELTLKHVILQNNHENGMPKALTLTSAGSLSIGGNVEIKY